MRRFGSAAWSCSLRDGEGSVATESRALKNYPYTFFSRYAEKPGTNPEELLGVLSPFAPGLAGGVNACGAIIQHGRRTVQCGA
jgi:hypothetical protein